MANKIEKKAVRFQATGNMAEEAAKIGKSIESLGKSLDKMGKDAKEATSVAAQGVEEFQNSVKNFAKSLVTVEAIKAGFQAITQYVGEAVKKFQEAEIASGKSLDQISKNATKLQKDLDKLQISVGRLVNALSEEALAGEDNQKSFVSVLTSLVEKASEASDEIVEMGKALALVNPITGPIIVSFTVLGGIVEELTRKIDDMTGASKASVEELEKLAKLSQKNVDRFGGRGVPEVPDVPEPGPAENPMLRKKMARVKSAAKPAAPSMGVGDFSGGFAEAEAESTKNDAIKEQILLRERIAELKLADLEYEAEVAAIMGRMDLTPKERELELQEAKIRQNDREMAQEDEKNRLREEGQQIAMQEVQTRMAVIDAAQTGAEVIGNAIGLETEMKIAAAAIDGAQAAYMSLVEFGLGNIAGGAALAAASVQAFALAGQSAVGAGGGSASGGKRKGGGTRPMTQRPGATAREAAASTMADTPSTTVYNVSFRSLSTPTAREARQIAQALDREGRSRV